MICPDLLVRDRFIFVFAAVCEICSDFQILIFLSSRASCCPCISDVDRAVNCISAVCQNLIAFIFIPGSEFFIIQREVIEGNDVVIEGSTLPMRKVVIDSLNCSFSIDGCRCRNISVLINCYCTSGIRTPVARKLEGYLRSPFQIMSIKPLRVDLVDDLALLDVLYFTTVIARIGNLIVLLNLDAILRDQCGRITVIGTVVASRYVSTSDFYFAVYDILLKLVVKCSNHSVFVSKSPYSTLFAAEIGCHLFIA